MTVSEDADRLYAALRGAKQGYCWCPHGIGHPLFHTHTAECVEARDALIAHEEREKHEPPTSV